MITAVMLNWKRPTNVLRILDSWRTGGIITEGIVWNNNPAKPLHHDWATVVNPTTNLGLYTRFTAASLARHECVLIQDDDLELPSETMRALIEAWRQDPEIMHGVFGRRAAEDGSYDPRNAHGEVPVILTRALLTHRRHAANFFQVAPCFEEIQRDSQPFGNGEDIIFSYTAMRLTGRLNRGHRLPVTNLPAPHSIHGGNWTAHLAHRSRLMRACETWLKGEADNNRGHLLHL